VFNSGLIWQFREWRQWPILSYIQSQLGFNSLSTMQPLISEGSQNMRSVFLTVALSVFLGQAAEAQQIPYLFPASEGGGGLCGVSGCISPDKTISLGQITAPVLAAAQAWAQESAALSSAMTIMAPNPGDRFSLTFSGSGTDNYGAAAISGTVRITNQALAFGGYARSDHSNLVKGGVSLSFH
jgi:hypothetical protein